MTQVQHEAARLEQFYTFRNREEVLAYLQQHSALLDVLLAAPAQIKKYFPDNLSLALEVSRDTEEPNWLELLLWVELPVDLDDQVERMEQLRDNWLFDNWVLEMGDLHIMVDFK